MEEYLFVLQYGQWLILVLSILALYLVSSVKHNTRQKGYLMTALSRFSGAIIFLFVDLYAFVIANLIQTYIAIRGYFQNKKAGEEVTKKPTRCAFFPISRSIYVGVRVEFLLFQRIKISIFLRNLVYEKLQIAAYNIERKLSKPVHCLLDPSGKSELR